MLAVGKRVRPGKALKHLQGTVCSAEALSRPARPAFFLPFCCRRTPLVGAGSEAFVAKRDVRHPAAAEQAAGALLWFVLAAAKRVSAASKRAGREAVLAGCALGTDSFLLSI